MKKLERTKNAYKSMLTGGMLKICQTILPFIVRSVMIYTLGMQYLGLNSLFASVLQVLNLAELGVGTAMVFSMYKPIAEDDTEKICALMKLYRAYYRIIGFVVLILGILLLPFLESLIYGEIPSDINIYVLYCIHLSATVLSYWLFAYKNALLNAHQRNDVSNKITLVLQFLQYVIQIVLLLILKNYYYYIIILPIAQLCQNCVTAIYVNKMYPQYSARGSLLKQEISEINRRIRALFASKIGSVVLNSADSIVISAFLGLGILGIYNNYYYIMSSIIGFITIFFQSIIAGIGNSLITEGREKNYRDFNRLTFILFWIIGFCANCFVNLYQPFMSIWVGQENMLSFESVVLFAIYFCVYEFNGLLNIFKDAAGLWHEDRFRSPVVALANLIMNILLVNTIGINGVIISTILSLLLIGIPWIIHNVYKYMFSEYSIKEYLVKILRYSLMIVLATIITFVCCRALPVSIVGIAIRGILCFTITNVLFVLIYSFTKEIKYLSGILGRIRS